MSPSLDRPRTGKSISVSFAFAMRACVRASEAAGARYNDLGARADPMI